MFKKLKEKIKKRVKRTINGLFATEEALKGEISVLKNQLTDEIQKGREQQEDWEKKFEEIKNELGESITHNTAVQELLGERLESIAAEQDKFEEQLRVLQKERELYSQDQEEKMAAMAREIMRSKWKLVDYLEEQDKSLDKRVECNICGYQGLAEAFEKKVTECQFAGGKLERYICPVCGCIFGPTKFSNQTKEELADDYMVHYLGFNEADCTNGEEETFYLLNPTKEGVYLNYGCGKWANTITELRNQGYQVYGYEPYAKDIDNPYIISDIEVLKKMKFDGIFSHDLLEHLLKPVDEIIFMKSLLKSPNCKMAHSTACYEYKYTDTRFHTCFFTGNAVEELCKRANLNIENYVDDGNRKDFMCYVYSLKDEMLSFKNHMGTTHEGGDEELEIYSGEQMYGPYFQLSKGMYNLSFIFKMECDVKEELRLLVTAENGKIQINSYPITDGTNIVSLLLERDYEHVEFILSNTTAGKIVLEEAAFVS